MQKKKILFILALLCAAAQGARADDRRMADRAMKSCDRVLNALAILDDDPQRFAVLINALTADQPTRILSTDKKAQKAGGLCLALKGVPVKPTDDVDVDKEYQLIPIDSI